jgi:outer membrane protein TolC
MDHRSLYTLGISIIACTVVFAGCATVPRATYRATVELPPPPTSPIDADRAAARAVLISHRVRAAELRLNAAMARVEAASLPPDPALAIGLGIPIDGLGGSPVSISIMQGLAWLLSGEIDRVAASRERDAAAAELVAVAAEVAAEARRLVRALAAARDRRDALARGAETRRQMVAVERAAIDLGESTAIQLGTVAAELAKAELDAAAAALAARELEIALMSTIGIDAAPLLTPLDEEGTTATVAATQPTLDVLRARARVARAQSALDARLVPLGSNATLGVGLGRDLEDRESVDGTLEITLPIFRREQELVALEDELAAERAELAESERLAHMALAHARARIAEAESQRAAAIGALDAAEKARAATERAVTMGEASHAQLLRSDAECTAWRARVAASRIDLANAIALIELRTAPSTTHPDIEEGTR